MALHMYHSCVYYCEHSFTHVPFAVVYHPSEKLLNPNEIKIDLRGIKFSQVEIKLLTGEIKFDPLSRLFAQEIVIQ